MDHFQGPLTAQRAPMLIQVLRQSLGGGGNADARKQVTETMHQLEQCEGFCSLLHAIITNKDNDGSVRILAIICYRRAVERLWKPRVMTSARLISAAEKAQLRPRLFELLSETDRIHGKHIALLIAAVAQADFPSDWGSPMSDLMNYSKSVSEGSVQHQWAILSLHHTTKALASKVVPRARKSFEAVSPHVLEEILPLYNKHTGILLETLSNFSNGQIPALQLESDAVKTAVSLAWYALKVCRNILLYGIPVITANQAACNLLSLMLQHTKAFEACRLAVPKHPLSLKVEKFLVIIMETVRSLQLKKYAYFAPFLGAFLEFSWSSLSGCQGNPSHTISKLYAMRLLFIRDVLELYCLPESEMALNCSTYFKLEALPEALLAARAMAFQAFSKERVISLGTIVVTRFFVLSEDDLELWSGSPEDYLVARDREDETVCARVAAKNLYRILLSKMPEYVVELTHVMLNAVAQNNASSSIQDVLARDAVFYSLGLSHHHLSAALDIENILRTYLMRDLQQGGNNGHQIVVVTRIVWLLGYWVTGISATTRPDIYNLFLSSMSSDDLVLALTACNSLSQIVDDMGFSMEQFAPFVNSAFDRLFACMRRCQEISSLQMLLGVLSVLIEMLGNKIVPYVDNILKCLSGLWEGANDHGIMKSSVIQSLAKLVSVLGPAVSGLLSLLVPVIRSSTDLQQAHAAYMLEDGLLVWQYTVLQASQPSAELMELFPCLLPVIQCSTEHLECCMKILEAYVLLGKAAFLQVHGSILLKCLLVYLGNVQGVGTTLLTKTVQTIVQVFPREGPLFLEPVIGKALFLMFRGDEPLDCRQAYLVMLCAVAYHNTAYFVRVCRLLGEQVPPEQRGNGAFLLLAFVDFAYEQLELIRSPDLRKYLSLGMLSLLAEPSATPEILSKLTVIIDGALNVMQDADNCCRYAVAYAPPEEGEPYSIAEDELQRIFAEDPVYTVGLREHAIAQLQAAASTHGQHFQQAVAVVPQRMLAELQHAPQ